MTPEDLSERHPYLFHVTIRGAWDSIREHGLLPTSHLLDLFDISGEERVRLERTRRPTTVPIAHPVHGLAVLNDQMPLSEAALAKCLDDGLSPADWLQILNRRVFFWCDERRLSRMQDARANRRRARDVLVIETLPLARKYADRIELSPINSGSTMRKPTRRGLSTFIPLTELSYRDWARKRGMRDSIAELTVIDGVPDIARYVRQIRHLGSDELY